MSSWWKDLEGVPPGKEMPSWGQVKGPREPPRDNPCNLCKGDQRQPLWSFWICFCFLETESCCVVQLACSLQYSCLSLPRVLGLQAFTTMLSSVVISQRLGAYKNHSLVPPLSSPLFLSALGQRCEKSRQSDLMLLLCHILFSDWWAHLLEIYQGK
jgi:hypothetical protein